MPKKKFIDKKNSITYHLVHRSQKDPLAADEDAPQYVLEPVPGKVPDRKLNIKLPDEVLPSKEEEKVGLLNKAAPMRGPQPDLDPDIVETLDDEFDPKDQDNELDDDFVIRANAESNANQWSDVSDDEYDSSDYGSETRDVVADHFFDRFGNEETRSQFTEYSMSSSVVTRSKGLQDLDDRFEKFFELYKEEELGAMETDNIQGGLTTESEIFKQAVKEFEKHQEKQRTEFENGYGRFLEKDEESDSNPEEMEKWLVEKPTEKWDCESILSTYSTLYNHPKLIEEAPRKKKLIRICGKTGMVKEDGSQQLTAKALRQLDDTPKKIQSPQRRKDETKEEKLARKKEVKEHRQERRMERKANTQAFKEEKKRQEKILVNVQKNIQGIKLQ